MTKTDKNTLTIRNELFELIGTVTAKPLFTRYGLFSEKAMFGIYQEGVLYIRAEEELADYLVSLGAVNLVGNSLKPALREKLSLSNFFCLPNHFRNDKTILKDILLRSIQQIGEQKAKKSLARRSRIKNLPGLSLKEEKMLKKVDIDSLEALYSHGAANAYLLLLKHGNPIDEFFFWRLAAAMLRKHKILLTDEEIDIEWRSLHKAKKAERQAALAYQRALFEKRKKMLEEEKAKQAKCNDDDDVIDKP